MITESMVMVAIIVIFCFFSLRTGRRGIAVAVLPVAVLPLFYVMGSASAVQFSSCLPFCTPIQWQVVCVIAGLVISALLLGFFTGVLRSKRAKLFYLVLCGGSTAVFAFTILHTLIPEI